MTEVILPDEPPWLTPRAARALLAFLIASAKREYGEDWRQRILEEGEE